MPLTLLHRHGKVVSGRGGWLLASLLWIPGLAHGQASSLEATTRSLTYQGLPLPAQMPPLSVSTQRLQYQGPLLPGSKPPLSVSTSGLSYEGAPLPSRLAPLTARTEVIRYDGLEPPAQRPPLVVRSPRLQYIGKPAPALRPPLKVETGPLTYSGSPLPGSLAPLQATTARIRYSGVVLPSERPMLAATLPSLSYQGQPLPGNLGPLSVVASPLSYRGTQDRRETRFRLVRVTPLGPPSALDPFDYRDVRQTIQAITARTPDDPTEPPDDSQTPEPTPEPPPEPEPLMFSGIPQTVFGVINLKPQSMPTQWMVTTTETFAEPVIANDAAFGFYSDFGEMGLTINFEAGPDWQSTGLPRSVPLRREIEGFGYQEETVTFDLTRSSDGRWFSVTVSVSAGSDGDISIVRASGYDCQSSTGSCP